MPSINHKSCIILVVLLMLIAVVSCNKVKFDSKEWKDWQESENTFSLWNMAEDLTQTIDLKGKTVAEIKDLLGEPAHESETQLRYFLGYSGHGIDTGSLILAIEDGVITDIQLWHG